MVYSCQVVEVKIINDRIMATKLVVEGVFVNVVSVYAPQVGLEDDVKFRFRSELDELV